MYWIIGSVLGSLLSAALPMDFTGIDFSMTALFVVIFIDLIRNQKGRAGLDRRAGAVRRHSVPADLRGRQIPASLPGADRGGAVRRAPLL